MAIDQNRPLLKLNNPQVAERRRSGGGGGGGRTFAANQQIQKFGPRFTRLQTALSRPGGNIELRDDPTALAPERLIVIETSGSVSSFQNAVSKVPGLEYVGEQDLDSDEDASPEHYLLMPTEGALTELLQLWTRWQNGQKMNRGFTPWRDVFERLRDVRPWGPQDRVSSNAQITLKSQIEGLSPTDRLRIEVELVFRSNETVAEKAALDVRQLIRSQGGEVVSEYRRVEFAYHAILAELSVAAITDIINRASGSLAGSDPIAFIVPQSTFSDSREALPQVPPATDALEFNPVFPQRREPVVAIFDAVPIQAHPFLSGGLVIDDPFDLNALSVGEREHGTAIASAVLHGDLRQPYSTPTRPIYFRPVMYAPAPSFRKVPERFVDDRLIVDVMCEAVERMASAQATDVLVVNLSLGDIYRPFHKRISMWARALDYLASRYGVVFIVSAGNEPATISLDTVNSIVELEALDEDARQDTIFNKINALKADRKIIAPAESINALTVGAWHNDVTSAPHPNAAFKVPFPNRTMPNLSSRLGLGVLNSIKPDVLFSGGREHYRVSPTSPPANIDPVTKGTRFAGVCVAGQITAARQHDYTLGSSIAAAMATGTAARLHDSLEAEYGDVFLNLPKVQKASLLKALLVHPANWRGESERIKSLVNPANVLDWEKERAEVARYLGYGFVEPAEAVYCSQSRATLWTTGSLGSEAAIKYSIALPTEFGRLANIRQVITTLAWISPVRPRHSQYRATKLRVTSLQSEESSKAGVATHPNEPGYHNIERGTVSHRRWVGDRIGDFGVSPELNISIQRDKDTGPKVDADIHFGLVISLEMDGGQRIYDEVLNSLAIRPRSQQRIQP